MKLYIRSAASRGDNTDRIINKLTDEAKRIVHSTMTNDFGFEDEEVAEYSVVEVTPQDDRYVKVEVRAEVSFQGLVKLMDKLSEWISKYDPDAYFDAEDTGITNAFVDICKIS